MEAQNLMLSEKYKEALVLLEDLKQLEKDGDFEYELIHRLYQLISNATSFYNQQVILGILNSNTLKKNQNFIYVEELGEHLKKEAGLELDINTLKRELELLVLRDLISLQIEGNKIIF